MNSDKGRVSQESVNGTVSKIKIHLYTKKVIIMISFYAINIYQKLIFKLNWFCTVFVNITNENIA